MNSLWSKYRNHSLFIAFIFVYLILGLVNLTTLPVAWTDEVQNLDPAIQFYKFGNYFSKLWPNPGAENTFASYPPLIEIWHIIWLHIVNPTMFNVRLPFLIFHIITLCLLYNITNNHIKNNFIALLIVILFAFDKSVFELSRSMRIEVIILLLITIYYSIQKFNNPVSLGLISGLLLIAHLYTLPIVFAWFIKSWFNQNKKFIVYFVLFLLIPLVSSLFLIDFKIAEIVSQLGLQTAKHTPQSSGIVQILSDSFFHRFFPFYLEQPLMYLIYIILMILPVAIFIQHKNSYKLYFFEGYWLELLLLGFTIFFAMSAQYRYLPSFLLIGILGASSKIDLNSFKIKIILGVIAVNGFMSFSARHATAIMQRNERIPEPFIAFLEKNIPQNKKILILGECIGEYYSAVHKECDFGLEYHPVHFNFNDYSNVYYLSKDSIPYKNCLFIGKYYPNQKKLPSLIKMFAKGATYANTYLWKVPNDREYQRITKPFLIY